MLLTLTSTASTATDLGFLLHKHPDRAQSFDLPVGTAHVFYPEASGDRCTVALLLEVDPIGIVRGKRFGGDGSALSQYVNDRPYAASSMMAVALGKVFGTAMKGRCAARPDLEGRSLPLTVHVPAVPSDGGGALVESLFAPLGWSVTTRVEPLDPDIPRWGASRYVEMTLEGTMPLADALSHLYVLLPVLDGSKHYWVGSDEVDKLVRSGGAWLQDHPQRDVITRRYLAHQPSYVVDATERLAALDDAAPDLVVDPEEAEPRRVPLVRRRVEAILTALRDVGARRVVDLGCGEGTLLRELITDVSFTEVVGVDVSARELQRAARRLGLERMPDTQRARLTLRQSSLTYRDPAIEGYDAVVLMEVIEHVDPERLPTLARNVFGHARPGSVVVTTPNADHNPLYEHLAAGELRHSDHRFEWGREEFAAWAGRVAEDHGYAVQLRPVGEAHPERGAPTQLALFTRVPSGEGADR